MSRTIVFIFEGEVRENQICSSIEKNYFIDGTVIKRSYCNDVYELYEELKEDEFLDIIEVIREQCSKKGLPEPFPDITDRDNVSEIFLFFDLEIQDDKFSFESLTEMINYFREETEQGKLYISYPMIESIRDIPNDDVFIHHYIDSGECRGSIYKGLSADRGHKKYQDIRKFDNKTWAKLVEISMQKAMHITGSQEHLSPDDGQYLILKAQQEIENAHSRIAVLNSFPFYLSDYYGFESVIGALNQLE